MSPLSPSSGFVAILGTLLLAGCSEPLAPEPAPRETSDAPGASPVAMTLRAAGELPLRCDPIPQRSERGREGEVLIQVRGCILASLDEAMGRRLGPVAGPFADIDIPQGVLQLTVLVHLRGPEALNATLELPDILAYGARGAGDGNRDSVVWFELPKPPAGTWELRSGVVPPTVARPWSVTAWLRVPA